MSLTPSAMALASAFCSALATIFIQRGLQGSNYYAGFWINVVVGMVALWSAVLTLVPPGEFTWRAVPYFVLAGVLGTAAGRFFRVVAIEKVGAPVAASINNLHPFIATSLAIVLLGERVTLSVIAGTLVIVLGTIQLSQSGKHVGFERRDLVYAFLSAVCFGVVAVIRKMGLSQVGPLWGSAINVTAAMIAATAFVLATGNLRALRCDRRSLLYFVGGGVLENAGVFLVLVALGLGQVSVVIPLAGTAPLFVLFLAFLFPTGVHTLSWRVVLGSALIVLGVVLITAIK